MGPNGQLTNVTTSVGGIDLTRFFGGRHSPRPTLQNGMIPMDGAIDDPNIVLGTICPHRISPSPQLIGTPKHEITNQANNNKHYNNDIIPLAARSLSL
jgi:hypothetical protein